MKNIYIRIIILAAIITISNGCIKTYQKLPPSIDIRKNQLRYIDEKMEIWANDGLGRYHKYLPKDSLEYRLVTNHIGTNLNSIFLGYCNYHKKSEIVSVGPEIVSIISNKPNFKISKMSQEEMYQKSRSKSIDNIHGVSIITNPSENIGTHSTITSEQKIDTKN